ncbi:WD40/YVTN/BNR-like repeat-containing protein [Draconibacterium halophilum]|uniref:Photosynthesis system II assembly factor Ycf48/Hcf136-like domain-containing protein n=1 Tax=Draconibacterium halophilum TaxID=2706887 RepID=A0A6C0RHK0_9BACT|nr:YCF48-related protein [Draconibacterium halophilum]QIA09579.1 hypothetical protein G0Q07_18520 [Draconibacterium halophilum]
MKFLLIPAFILLLFSCTLTPKKQVAVVFSELNTNTEASFRGLHVVDENTVWASGSGGTVFVSNDSGNSWKDVSIQGTEGNDFRSIHAWDDKKAIVFGVAGPEFAYKTIDGGNTWNVVYSDTTSGLFFNSLKFADEKNGLAVSDPVNGKFFVLRTEDAGNTWTVVENLPSVIDGEANFAA